MYEDCFDFVTVTSLFRDKAQKQYEVIDACCAVVHTDRQTDRQTEKHARVADTVPFGNETRLQNRLELTNRCMTGTQC